MKNYLININNFCNNFFNSISFALLIFSIAALVVLLGAIEQGLIVFVVVMTVILFFCSDIKTTTLPFLLAVTFVSGCYDSYDRFIGYWWLGIPLIISLLFNIIAYRKPFKPGITFYGLLAVTLAVSLGGVGVISKKDYFAPAALYAVAGLGIGMVFTYYVIKSRYIDSEYRTAFSALCRAVYLMGMLTCLFVINAYVEVLPELMEKFRFPIESNNNFATYIMLAMPLPFAYSVKNKLHIPVAFFMYICLLLLGSRGGFLMGTIEFVICLIWMIVCDKKNRILHAVLFGGSVLIFAIYFDKIIMLFNYDTHSFISSTEARCMLIYRAINNFKEAPIFGSGLGFTGNIDIYNPVKGALPWYHMMIPQIVGSLGLLGILSYGFLLVGRAVDAVKRYSLNNSFLILSYIGLFLMSQVNPGEFCPLPYELLAVMTFAIIENSPKGSFLR